MKAIQTVSEEFERAKVKYTQQIADFANKPANIDPLFKSGVIGQLSPLLLDITVSVKNNSALALGRMANHSPELAEAVVVSGALPQLVMSLAEQNTFYKKAACTVLREVAKHSSALAKAVINCEALESLAICLEEFDSGVKEQAALVIANVAKHNEELAQAVIEAGTVLPLVLALQNPQPTLKRACAQALNEISKHSVENAEILVEAGAIMVLNPLIGHHDHQLKKQVCQCLSNIAKRSQGLAESVVGAELFPKILYRLKDMEEGVRRMAATVIREVVKQSPELAKLYVQSGGVAATIEYLVENKESSGATLLPGIVILGYVGAYDPQTALSIINNRGTAILKEVMTQIPDDLVKSAAAWALGQVGSHSPDHARRVAQEQGLIHLLAVYLYKDSTEEIRSQAQKSLKSLIKMCLVMQPLEAIIDDSPPEILRQVLKQMVRILSRAKSSKNQQQRSAMKLFAMSKGLRKIQSMKVEPSLKLLVDEIVGLYPSDVAQFYSSEYQQALINKVT